MLDSPMRVVLEVVPDKFITYDGAKLEAHTQGTLEKERMTEMSDSDRVRHAAQSTQESADK